MGKRVFPPLIFNKNGSHIREIPRACAVTADQFRVAWMDQSPAQKKLPFRDPEGQFEMSLKIDR